MKGHAIRKSVYVLLGAAVLASICATALALPSIPSSKFASAETCSCHGPLQSQWKRSMHAKAIIDPIYTLKRDEAAAADPALGEFCDGCHAPVAIMAGESTADPASLPRQSAEGVGCDYCHQITNTQQPLGNVSQTVNPDGTRRAQLSDAQAPHPTAFSEFHKSAEFCGACHNVNHPVNNLPLEATYTEWAAGPYAAQGIVCQDCHMTPGPGPTNNPGSAATGGPRRDHIYNMTFAGGNVALGDSELAEERLKAAATLDLALEDIVAEGTQVPLKVTITNSGAGHYLPTGLTEMRQMWLKVTATKADGSTEELLHRDFGTVLADAAGNAPVDLWEAASIQSDDRIPPQGTAENDLTFTMNDPDTVKVEAALYYRSVSEDVANKAKVDVPVTTMAKTSVDVYTSAEKKAAAAQKSDDTENKKVESNAIPWYDYVLIALAVLVAIGVVYFVIRRRTPIDGSLPPVGSIDDATAEDADEKAPKTEDSTPKEE